MRRLYFFAGLVVLVVIGVSRTDAADAPAPPNRLLFYHWWNAPGERAALNALVQIFKAQSPGVEVTTTSAVAGGDVRNLLVQIQRQVAAGDAPEAFQMHAGYGAEPFFDAGLLRPVDEVWKAEGLEKIVPPLIASMSKIKDHYYAIPVGVHRINVVWYNQAVLDESGIDPSSLTTWDAFFAACEKLRKHGIVSPIRMGDVGWTGGIVFQDIVASFGADTYESWLNGKITALDDPHLILALEIFVRYVSYTNTERTQVGWDVALRQVIAGKSAFSVMGDWSNTEFKLAGKKYGKDYGAFVVPGTKDMYGITVDTFLRPRRVANDANADHWLKLAASREGQDAFNTLKGSIPARNDPDLPRYDAYQAGAIADLKSAKLVYPSVDNAVPRAYGNTLNDVLNALAADGDVKKAAAALAKATTTLAPKYTRTWSLKNHS